MATLRVRQVGLVNLLECFTYMLSACQVHSTLLLTRLERSLERVWIKDAEVRREGVGVLDVDGGAGRDEGMQCVEGDKADATVGAHDRTIQV